METEDYSLAELAELMSVLSVENRLRIITLLRDFVAWEPRKLLRNRAKAILKRMEDAAEDGFAAV